MPTGLCTATGDNFTLRDGQPTFGAILDRVLRQGGVPRCAPDATLFAAVAPSYDALESIERLVLRRA